MFDKLKNTAIQSLKLKAFNEKSSGWTSYQPINHLTEMPDTSDPVLLLDYLLSQFNNTNPENQEIIKPILKQWIEKIKDHNNDDYDSKELRDFIYEMF